MEIGENIVARPIKDSLSYFSFDTDFFSDRKIRRLLKTFGGKGTTIYTYLLCEIYRNNGYFIQWDENYPEDISDTLGSGFAKNLVLDVVALSLKYDLFDKHLFDSFQILTSAGTQKRYVLAKETINKTKYSPEKLIKKEYLLIPLSDSLTPLNDVQRDLTPKNGFLPLKGKERKGKETKGKESKKKITPSKKSFEASAFLRDEDNPLESDLTEMAVYKITKRNPTTECLTLKEKSALEDMALSSVLVADLQTAFDKTLERGEPKTNILYLSQIARDQKVKRLSGKSGKTKKAGVAQLLKNRRTTKEATNNG